MNAAELKIEQSDIRKLLGAASGDAALLYIYLHAGNDPALAGQVLNLNERRTDCAMATLRQLGLWQPQAQKLVLPGQCPSYTERDVISAMDMDKDFRDVYGEVQRILGKPLNTEELKIILSFQRYLGLAPDVICLLVSYCKRRAEEQGKLRNPSLRTIEKEAYLWAEQGIETLEQAAAYIQTQNLKNSRIERLKKVIQVRGRNLTAGEERYANSWLDMGFEEEAIAMAYERTCLNTGGLNWPYMNKILQRWHEAGLHTAAEVKQGDRKPAIPKGASGQLGQAELEAIAKIMQEG